MQHVQSRWELCRGAMVGALGCCLLTGCTLVSRDWFDTGSDAGSPESELDADGPVVRELGGDGVRPRSPADRPEPVGSQDGGPDLDAGSEDGSKPADVPDASEAPDAGEAPDAATPPPKDSGPKAEPDANGGPVKPDAGKPMPDAGAAPPGQEPAPGPDALIDAIDAEEEARTEKWCECAANRAQCALGGFDTNSCEEWGLSVLSNSSEAAVVALLTCQLMAEEAYTKCVDSELNCATAQPSVRGCTRAYQLATMRCNNTSIAGLTVQELCSR